MFLPLGNKIIVGQRHDGGLLITETALGRGAAGNVRAEHGLLQHGQALSALQVGELLGVRRSCNEKWHLVSRDIHQSGKKVVSVLPSQE